MEERKREALEDLQSDRLSDLGYHDPEHGPAPPSDMNGLMEEIIFHKEFDFHWVLLPWGLYECSIEKSYKDRTDVVNYKGPLDEHFLQWIKNAMWKLNRNEV